MKSAFRKQIVVTLFYGLLALVGTFGRCVWMAFFLASVAGALAEVTEEQAPVRLQLIDGRDVRFTAFQLRMGCRRPALLKSSRTI
jgi:hypothetical protein